MVDQALPFDVLLMVMDLSSPRTIAAMMRTCRALYRDSKGPRLLLRNGATLGSNFDVLSFAAFMFASQTASSRFRYLRALAVSHGGFSDGAVRMLAAILTHADLKLDSLSLYDAEKVLGSGSPQLHAEFHDDGDDSPLGPILLRAFSSLTTLRHLRISSMADHGHELLNRLPSTLVSASLAFDSAGAGWGTFGDPDSRNPIVRLASSADTLEVLAGSGFDIRSEVVGYDIVYPRVRRICATYKPDGAMPATAAYVHSFPNVEHLALTAPYDPILDVFPYAAEERLATRQANRDDQVNHGSWQRLRVVEGTVRDVWMLGLVCHVPDVRLKGDITRVGLTRGGLDDVLGDVQPASLTFSAIGSALFGSNGPMSRVLHSPAAQCLRTLDLEVVFAPSEGDADASAILDDMFETLAPLPLHTLKLTLNFGLLRLSFSPLEREFMDTDLKLYAKRFTDAMPSLETAAVRLSRDRGGREHMLGPVGRDSMPPYGGEEDEGSASGGEQVMQELAELGFGTALNDDDEDW